ncbi:VanZ family protein [Olivibacter sp. EAT-5]|nr:VanZ family protein [Pseudosphingobacterium sp.]
MKWIWRVWCVLYFFILLYVVFFASRRPSPMWGRHLEDLRIVPFRTKWYLYTHMRDLSNVYLDVIGNIVMFTPLSLFLYIVFGIKHYGKILFLGFFLSFCIEAGQYFMGVGVPDVDDLIFNTFGVLLGVIIIDGVRRVPIRSSVTRS